MKEYRVTAIRRIEHTAIVEASSQEEARQKYLESNWGWVDEVDLGCDDEDITQVEEE